MKGKAKKTYDKQDIKQALIKKALGYDATEVIEEYVQGEQGDIKLAKKKVTKKSVPPDVSALKILIESEGEKCVLDMTDEELEKEKLRLLDLLNQYEKNKE